MPTELRSQHRRARVLGLLAGKGLLDPAISEPRPNIKVSIRDVLWVGHNTDKIVLEVLPAALIHFPKSFIHPEQLPIRLREIIAEIKKGATTGAEYEGIEFRLMAARARQVLPDRRVRPIGVRKVSKCYRMRPTILLQIKLMAASRGLTDTAYLESLVVADAKNRKCEPPR